MFEHKNLDGRWNRVIPATDAFVSGEVLECRVSVGSEPEKISRQQYAVVGDRLVERCLPPESVGDAWSYDAGKLPWWGSVNNPPHAGLLADFNSHYGGLRYAPLDVKHNVIGFASDGEEIIFSSGTYTVTRKSDGKELSASSVRELRDSYFA
ncbi:MAG: hypothetical protein ACU84J_16595 [Gammaproteobacteria bacterium]